MNENASLGDYLILLRREVAPPWLYLLIGTGAAAVVAGAVLGARFAALTGLGVAVVGLAAWARMHQLADALDNRFGAVPTGKARQYRAVGGAALFVGGAGATLAFFVLAYGLILGRFW